MIQLRPIAFPPTGIGLPKTAEAPWWRYRVEFWPSGELLLASTRDPEYDAAREMQRRGMSGPFETVNDQGAVRMRFPSIEEAAKWTIKDRRDGKNPPRLARWEPYVDRRSDIADPGGDVPLSEEGEEAAE